MPQWASTLLAVVAGGLLTYFAQRLLENHRAGLERERDADLATAELRVATRLILDELDTIALHYTAFADDGRYPQAQDPAHSGLIFPTDAWEANKRVLAAGLSDEQWDLIAPVMHAAARVRVIILRGAPLEPIPPSTLQELRNGAEIAHNAYVVLAGKPPPSLAWGEV